MFFTTLVVRELLFVEAARAVGVSTARILLRHVLPNLISPILVQASFIFAYAILAEAARSFLGDCIRDLLDPRLRKSM